ncbi:MAG: hypothetical protein J2P31_01180, partial [Blastocatellia bacterium]|nr:hypothetical protein [Blastocatellia bacterium]
TLVTAKWMSEQVPAEGKKFVKNGKKEKEEFVLIMVKTGCAAKLIKEIKDSPMRRMQDELNRLALATDSEASATIKMMRPKQLEEFCRYNDIPIIRTTRGTIDKNKTQPNILQKLAGRREYVKL